MDIFISTLKVPIFDMIKCFIFDSDSLSKAVLKIVNSRKIKFE